MLALSGEECGARLFDACGCGIVVEASREGFRIGVVLDLLAIRTAFSSAAVFRGVAVGGTLKWETAIF